LIDKPGRTDEDQPPAPIPIPAISTTGAGERGEKLAAEVAAADGFAFFDELLDERGEACGVEVASGNLADDCAAVRAVELLEEREDGIQRGGQVGDDDESGLLGLGHDAGRAARAGGLGKQELSGGEGVLGRAALERDEKAAEAGKDRRVSGRARECAGGW
jgi:hypothetical protein